MVMDWSVTSTKWKTLYQCVTSPVLTRFSLKEGHDLFEGREDQQDEWNISIPDEWDYFVDCENKSWYLGSECEN